MRLPTTRTMALVCTMCAVTACGSDSESTTESTPFHAVPAEAVVVSGTAACEFSEEGIGTDGEPAHYVGEGAYEGLEFHYYYFFHADLGEAAEIRGWITGGA